MGNIACLFPGQGPATLIDDLLAGLEKEPETEKILKLSDKILGWELSSLIKKGGTDEIRKNTRFSQLIVFVVSYIWWEVLKREEAENFFPDVFAGHSVALWTASVAAGAITFQTALESVDQRGDLMQRDCEENPGMMLVLIEPNLLKILKELKEFKSEVSIAAINSESQSVLSGSRSEIEKVRSNKIGDDGWAKRGTVLEVAGAFHSKKMRVAELKFRDYLSTIEITQPKAPIMANSEIKLLETPEDLREELARLTYTVLWHPSMQFLRSDLNIETFIEVGPGEVHV